MTKQPIQQQVEALARELADTQTAMEELVFALRSQREQIAVLEAVAVALVQSGATDEAGLRRAFDEATDAADPDFRSGLALALSEFLMRLEAGRER